MIRARQIKAARALLDWSQDDLAAATGLSVTTIRNLESGDMSPRNTTANEVRRAIENAGLEFIEPGGVRCRINEVKIYQGRDSCDAFFADILHTMKESGGTIVSIFTSLEMLADTCSLTQGRFERLEQLGKHADIKCLLPEILNPPLPASFFEYRAILKQHIGPVSYFVYGNKFAIVAEEGFAVFRYLVHDSVNLAQRYRSHFISLWELAPPIFTQVKIQNRAVRA